MNDNKYCGVPVLAQGEKGGQWLPLVVLLRPAPPLHTGTCRPKEMVVILFEKWRLKGNVRPKGCTNICACSNRAAHIYLCRTFLLNLRFWNKINVHFSSESYQCDDAASWPKPIFPSIYNKIYNKHM